MSPLALGPWPQTGQGWRTFLAPPIPDMGLPCFKPALVRDAGAPPSQAPTSLYCWGLFPPLSSPLNHALFRSRTISLFLCSPAQHLAHSRYQTNLYPQLSLDVLGRTQWVRWQCVFRSRHQRAGACSSGSSGGPAGRRWVGVRTRIAYPASRPPKVAYGLGHLCASADSSLSSRVLPSFLPSSLSSLPFQFPRSDLTSWDFGPDAFLSKPSFPHLYNEKIMIIPSFCAFPKLGIRNLRVGLYISLHTGPALLSGGGPGCG